MLKNYQTNVKDVAEQFESSDKAEFFQKQYHEHVDCWTYLIV